MRLGWENRRRYKSGCRLALRFPDSPDTPAASRGAVRTIALQIDLRVGCDQPPRELSGGGNDGLRARNVSSSPRGTVPQ